MITLYDIRDNKGMIIFTALTKEQAEQVKGNENNLHITISIVNVDYFDADENETF